MNTPTTKLGAKVKIVMCKLVLNCLYTMVINVAIYPGPNSQEKDIQFKFHSYFINYYFEFGNKFIFIVKRM